MVLRRGLSSLMVLAGAWMLISGLEKSIWAIECEQSEPFSPAKCIEAYQVPPSREPFEVDGPEGCVNYYYLWCWPSPEQLCWAEGYGLALDGTCFHFLDEQTAYTDCYENYAPNVVMLEYHRSECTFHDGVCQCVWVIGEYAPLPQEVCDCAEVL